MPVSPESINFGWIVDGVLAGSSRPGYGNPLADHLKFFRSQGIGAIVSLTETALAAAEVRAAGFEYLHLPVPDGGAPSVEEADAFVAFVDLMKSRGVRVAAHCLAGLGRTGTLGAAYLIAHGIDADRAMRRASASRLGVEFEGPQLMSQRQEEMLIHYERVVRGRR